VRRLRAPIPRLAERRVFPADRFKSITSAMASSPSNSPSSASMCIWVARTAMRLLPIHMLTRYMPHFIALSGVFAFSQGEDTPSSPRG